eukprot:1693037-Alexandrium_andersonii.AAC.1
MHPELCAQLQQLQSCLSELTITRRQCRDVDLRREASLRIFELRKRIRRVKHHGRISAIIRSAASGGGQWGAKALTDARRRE